MANTTTFNISGTKTGNSAVSNAIGTLTLTNTDSTNANTSQSFAAGVFEAIALPDLSGTQSIKRVLIVPPSGNTGTILLKGVTGDTGVSLHKTEASLVSLFATTNLGLTCSADTVIEFVWG